MTIAEWIGYCGEAMSRAGLFFGHGTDNPHDEAAWLVLFACNAPCDGSFADWERTVTPGEAHRIDSLLHRRTAERVPLAYLTGTAWFCGFEFNVNEAVLVPRSPIAELIAERFSPWVDPARLHNVLDLCTGSACIAIATAHHLPWVSVDAVDLSAEALEVAAANVASHRLGDRVNLLRSDLFSELTDRCYGLIVANPPYVPAAERETLPAEFLAEPEAGLFAGGDGLDLVLQILLKAPDYLASNGVLVCETGEGADPLQRLLERVPFTWIEFEHGGGGVFTIGRRELLLAGPEVRAVLEAR